MLNSSKRRALALLTTASLLCCAAISQAGLFDRFKARPKVATKRDTSFASMRRGQSPMSEPAGTVWQQPADSVVTSTPWYSDPYQQSGPVYGGAECCSCGPDDKCAGNTKVLRQKCDQTYYPPVPPYCYPCYGSHPTCWRRMQECSICPREANPPPPVPRAPKARPRTEPAPVPPKAVEPPEPLDDPSAMKQRSRMPRMTANVAPQKPAAPAAPRSRWTSYTDALPDDVEEEIPETPADTLEEMIEAEDDAQLDPPAGELESDEADEESVGETIEEGDLEATEDETEAVEQ